MSNTFKKMCLNSIRTNWVYILVVLFCFGLGCTLGVLAVDYLKQSQVNELKSYLDQFINQASNLQLDSQQAAKANIFHNLTAVGAIYLMGLTVLGIPLVLMLLFIRGFALGFTVGFLTKQKGWQGVLLALVSLLPHNLFYLPVLFVVAVAALSFSVLLVQRYFNSKLAVWYAFIGYNVITLVVCVVAVGAGLVEAYLTPIIIKSAAALLPG